MLASPPAGLCSAGICQPFALNKSVAGLSGNLLVDSNALYAVGNASSGGGDPAAFSKVTGNIIGQADDELGGQLGCQDSVYLYAYTDSTATPNPEIVAYAKESLLNPVGSIIGTPLNESGFTPANVFASTGPYVYWLASNIGELLQFVAPPDFMFATVEAPPTQITPAFVLGDSQGLTWGGGSVVYTAPGASPPNFSAEITLPVPTTLSTLDPDQVAMDANYVYYFNSVDKNFYASARNGSSLIALTSSGGLLGPAAPLIADCPVGGGCAAGQTSAYIYWVDTSNTIWRLPATTANSTPATFVKPQSPTIGAIAVDNFGVYWITASELMAQAK